MIFIALMLVIFSAQSQSFEGTVKWSMKTEMTDPKMKAQMEHAQQQANDPANQAKMKEMEEKMNDPQMKAMMDANPQMKAQMENAMKMMQGGGGGNMSSMMPSGFLIKVKGENTLTIMEGGMMPMEILHLKDKSVRLDRKNKTFSEMPKGENPKGKSTAQVQVTKTNEKATILNYSCTKYIAVVTEKGKTVNQVYWTTTDIKDIDMSHLKNQRMNGSQPLLYEGIEGVPLKMEISMPEAKMVMEVMEIKKESLNASDFTIPSDYKEVKGGFGR